MKTEFIPYEQALALKELGFDEPCFGLFVSMNNKLLIKEIPNQQESEQYFGGILAPLFQQAFRFFREKNLIGLVGGGYFNNRNTFNFEIWNDFKDTIFDEYYPTYEEAELECLKKLIETVKNGK